MKIFFTERNIVVVLFVAVLITFSLAQEDTKKLEKMYAGSNSATASFFIQTENTSLPVHAISGLPE
jgi:hypothetical protein